MTNSPPLNLTFRNLVLWVVRRGKPDHVKPRTMAWAASAAGISKQHLFNLMNGKRHASAVCAAKIARGWNIDTTTVTNALGRTIGEAVAP